MECEGKNLKALLLVLAAANLLLAGMVLTDGEPGNAALTSARLGGGTITTDAPWNGKWTPLGEVRDGRIAINRAEHDRRGA
jgi:hypothetical protein